MSQQMLARSQEKERYYKAVAAAFEQTIYARKAVIQKLLAEGTPITTESILEVRLTAEDKLAFIGAAALIICQRWLEETGFTVEEAFQKRMQERDDEGFKMVRELADARGMTVGDFIREIEEWAPGAPNHLSKDQESRDDHDDNADDDRTLNPYLVSLMLKIETAIL